MLRVNTDNSSNNGGASPSGFKFYTAFGVSQKEIKQQGKDNFYFYFFIALSRNVIKIKLLISARPCCVVQKPDSSWMVLFVLCYFSMTEI